MFCKRNPFSDSSRGTSTQTIVNNTTEQCKAEVMEKDNETDSNNNSVHSNWSELVPINNETNNTSMMNTEVKRSEGSDKKEGNKEHCSSSLQTKTKGLGELESKIPLCY